MTGVEILARHLLRYGIVTFLENSRKELYKPEVEHIFIAGERRTQDFAVVRELEACFAEFPRIIHLEIGTGKRPLNHDFFVEHAPHVMRQVCRIPPRYRYPKIVDGITIPLDNPKRSVFACGSQQRITAENRRQIVGLAYMFEAARRAKRERVAPFGSPPLSEQQVKVAKLASTGMYYSDIARHLAIREVTVRFHLAKARERYGLASNIQFLVAFNQQFS